MKKKIKQLKEKGQRVWTVGKKVLSKIVSGKIGKISIGALVVVFLCLGFHGGWSVGPEGCSCSGGYKPPDPNEVRKIIKPDSVTHPILPRGAAHK